MTSLHPEGLDPVGMIIVFAQYIKTHWPLRDLDAILKM